MLLSLFKPRKLKPYLVFANVSPVGYFQVGVVLARNPEDAISFTREIAGQSFQDAYGLWLPIWEGDAQELTAEEIELEGNGGPILGYSVQQ